MNKAWRCPVSKNDKVKGKRKLAMKHVYKRNLIMITIRSESVFVMAAKGQAGYNHLLRQKITGQT